MTWVVRTMSCSVLLSCKGAIRCKLMMMKIMMRLLWGSRVSSRWLERVTVVCREMRLVVAIRLLSIIKPSQWP